MDVPSESVAPKEAGVKGSPQTGRRPEPTLHYDRRPTPPVDGTPFFFTSLTCGELEVIAAGQ